VHHAIQGEKGISKKGSFNETANLCREPEKVNNVLKANLNLKSQDIPTKVATAESNTDMDLSTK